MAARRCGSFAALRMTLHVRKGYTRRAAAPQMSPYGVKTGAAQSAGSVPLRRPEPLSGAGGNAAVRAHGRRAYAKTRRHLTRGARCGAGDGGAMLLVCSTTISSAPPAACAVWAMAICAPCAGACCGGQRAPATTPPLTSPACPVSCAWHPRRPRHPAPSQPASPSPPEPPRRAPQRGLGPFSAARAVT